MNAPAAQCDYYPPFNERIVEAMQNESACTALDASVKNYQIAGCLTMRDSNQELLLQDHIYYKE